MISFQGKGFPSIPGKLSLVVLASVALVSAANAQMVGPVAPPEKPVDNTPLKERMTESFKKMFTPQPENTSADDIKSGTGNAAAEPAEDAPPAKAEPPRRPPMLKQAPLSNARVTEPEVDPENPPITRIKVDDPGNPLGLADATNRMKDIIALMEQSRFAEAQLKLMPLRQWLVDSAEAHINLYKTLNNIPSARAQAELEKQLGLEFALLRDRALFEMAKIYINQNDSRKAVKELTDVVKSQPKSQIGIRAYEMLQEIGFTEKLHLSTQ